MSSPITQGNNTNPITKITDPNSIKANEIPKNSEAKVAGDDDDDDDDDSDAGGKGMGKGGDPRMWIIIVHNS